MLSILDLEGNDIADIEELQYVQELTMLRALTLRKNPIEHHHHPIAPNPFYVSPNRLLFIYLVPNITVLDGIPVGPDEKVASLNLYNPVSSVTSALQHAADCQKATRQYARIRANDLALSTK